MLREDVPVDVDRRRPQRARLDEHREQVGDGNVLRLLALRHHLDRSARLEVPSGRQCVDRLAVDVVGLVAPERARALSSVQPAARVALKRVVEDLVPREVVRDVDPGDVSRQLGMQPRVAPREVPRVFEPEPPRHAVMLPRLTWSGPSSEQNTPSVASDAMKERASAPVFRA